MAASFIKTERLKKVSSGFWSFRPFLVCFLEGLESPRDAAMRRLVEFLDFLSGPVASLPQMFRAIANGVAVKRQR
jgi:hypothetical protein